MSIKTVEMISTVTANVLTKFMKCLLKVLKMYFQIFLIFIFTKILFF